jgi:hypothetical protein
MPRQHSTGAARHIVENAPTELPIDLIAELAEPLAEYMNVNAVLQRSSDLVSPFV